MASTSAYKSNAGFDGKLSVVCMIRSFSFLVFMTLIISLPGDKVFELMDTFGFPIDLSILMAHEKGKEVDVAGFDRALKLQKDRSRASSVVENEDWVILKEDVEVKFIGYDKLSTETSIIKYRAFRQKEQKGYQIVLKETPFYAENLA